jgi:pyruvate kinase
MVARGDLGVELPAHEVPLVQKNWFAKQKWQEFQLLLLPNDGDNDTSLTPRAEDVANSVMDGSDAVMLQEKLLQELSCTSDWEDDTDY